MKGPRFLAAAALAVGLADVGRADDDQRRFTVVAGPRTIGTWEAVQGDLPKGSTVEFTRDGKLKLTAVVDKNKIVIEGTYAVVGDKLKLTMKGPDGREHKETLTIEKLTADELATKDSRGQLDGFKRVRPK
jgi:uncharacterized protein (TIGR03066 family)